MTYVNFLIIEMSLEVSFVLLCVKQRTFSTHLPARSEQNHLLPAIEGLLKSQKLSLQDLHFLCVGRGPGSFTGTRVAVCLAKTLAFANQIPLVPFLSPLAYTPPISEPFLLLIDAKSRGIYAYDGADITSLTLPLNRCAREKQLYSPHPSSLPIPTLLAPINTSFLVCHLENSFAQGKTVSPFDLRAYLPPIKGTGAALPKQKKEQ